VAFRLAKIVKTESKMEVSSSWGYGKIRSYCLMGTELQFLQDENSSREG
jgi:hypothetical protein